MGCCVSDVERVLGELFRRRWDGRGMMVHNEPVVAAFHVRKAVARRKALALSLVNERKSVLAGVDRRTVVYANQLIAKCDVEARQNLEGRHKIIPQGGTICANSR